MNDSDEGRAVRMPLEMNVNGVRIRTPVGEVNATGQTAVIVVFCVLILAAVGYSVSQNSKDHAETTKAINSLRADMNASLSDLKTAQDDQFLSQLMTEEQKRNLPAWVKSKVERKMEQKARRVSD